MKLLGYDSHWHPVGTPIGKSVLFEGRLASSWYIEFGERDMYKYLQRTYSLVYGIREDISD